MGFVGRNGSGKTTLFRLIRGELALDVLHLFLREILPVELRHQR